jgi:uncharacterized membrane protein YozB (DUF420 family)
VTSITTDRGFPLRPEADRTTFLVLLVLVWIGVLSGFVPESISHVSRHGLDYPLIVHFHAVAFSAWLVLFTVQTALIRRHRIDLHKRLGLAGAALAAVMVVIGPATALVVAEGRFVTHHDTPEFLAIQFTDIVAFAGLTGAGLLLRGAPAAHKRLMLLGLIYISDAGFNRYLNQVVGGLLGRGPANDLFGLYGFSDILMLVLGAFDLITRRRLHPAYIAGLAWCLACEVIGVVGVLSPAWKATSLHLIGH